jgi:protein PhnA
MENVESFAFCRLAQELIDQMYLDEDTLAYAQATGEGEEDENKVIHRDSNVILVGDSVVLIKDLKVKGSSMVAKQGTAVRNIRLIMTMLNSLKVK